MPKRSPLVYLLSLLVCLLPITTFAWNPLGHMVVANIAYQSLDPIVKSKVDDLVETMKQEYPQIIDFVDMAPWADNLRAQRIETYSHWHYVDYALSSDGSPLKNLVDSDNAVYVLKNLQVVVKNPKANSFERARFLAFLEHIVGDLHQPLHTVSNITAENTNGDAGGNLYFVRYHNEKISLHRLWDGGFGAFDRSATPENVNEISKSIMQKYPESYFGKRAGDISLDTWTKEGMENAKNYIYTVSMNQTLSDQYVSTSRQIAEQNAALAGYRLAKILNLMFQ